MPTQPLILALAPHIALALVVAMAACIDWRRRRIPNWLTLTLAVAGLLVAGPRADMTFWQSAGGLAVGFFVPFVLFSLGMLGAGDAKLLAAIGAWMGPSGTIWVLLFAAIAGGVMSVALASRDRRLGVLFRNTGLIGLNLLTTRQTGFASAGEVARCEALKKATLPYAVAILAGLVGAQAMMLLPVVQRG